MRRDELQLPPASRDIVRRRPRTRQMRRHSREALLATGSVGVVRSLVVPTTVYPQAGWQPLLVTRDTCLVDQVDEQPVLAFLKNSLVQCKQLQARAGERRVLERHGNLRDLSHKQVPALQLARTQRSHLLSRLQETLRKARETRRSHTHSSGGSSCPHTGRV